MKKSITLKTNKEIPAPTTKAMIVCPDGYVGVGIFLTNPYRNWWVREDNTEIPHSRVLYWYDYNELYS